MQVDYSYDNESFAVKAVDRKKTALIGSRECLARSQGIGDGCYRVGLLFACPSRVLTRQGSQGRSGFLLVVI